MTLPLVSRLLIKQVQVANAIHQAEQQGLSTSELEQPRPLYHVCGLALSLFAMMFVADMLDSQYLFRSYWTGYRLHGAVSSEVLLICEMLTPAIDDRFDQPQIDVSFGLSPQILLLTQ